MKVYGLFTGFIIGCIISACISNRLDMPAPDYPAPPVDTLWYRPLEGYYGIIINPDAVRGDTVTRVWLRWGEDGGWIPYQLKDTLR